MSWQAPTHSNFVSAFAGRALMFVAIIPLMLMGYFILQEIDERFFPPLVDIRAVDYQLEGDNIKVHVIGRKVRDCHRLSVQGWYQDANGNNVPLDVTGVDDNSGHVTGPTDFGWWTLRPRPEASLFWVSVSHRCNPAYDQKTILGPFVFKEFAGKTMISPFQ